jgi:hypothetical protein
MSTTSLKTSPTRVSQDELDRLERMAGKDSYVYQRLAEQRAEYLKWEAERDREEAQLRQERESRQAAEAKTRADAREARRAAEEAEIRDDLRRRFFAANPSASTADYKRVAGRLYDDELMRRATEGRDAEIAALRRRGGYAM